MGNVFGRKRPRTPPPAPVSEHDQAILQLKTQRDKIKQFVKRNEKCMEKERELAKQLVKDGRKDRALLLLKKKKYQESVIEKTLRQLENIERMVQDLEFAEIQQRVVDGLRQGNEALKKMNSLFDVDEIERIMEETREGAEYQEEISNMLSGQLTTTEIADVEAELDSLLAAKADREAIDLPAVPIHEPQGAEVEEVAAAKEKSKREKVALEA